MKLALITTPPSVRSETGEYAAQLLPHLLERADVRVFVEPGLEGQSLAGVECEAPYPLMAREHDHLLFQVGNEAAHGFMARLIREHGGTVALHDWALPELARSAFPSLALGGFRGALAALREGGVGQARAYSRGGAGSSGELVLNRSAVRWADSFFVGSEELGRMIVKDRNSPTPIVVVPAREAGWGAVAEACVEGFEFFPQPRSKSKRMFWARVRQAVAERRARG